ncbi:MAG: PH domain-containing protein [Clostridium paraputrificum]
MIYILLFSGLIVLFTMYFINSSATKPNNNVVIGVTLPYMQLKNEKVLEIINRFKKENKYLMLASALLSIPMIFIKKYDSFIIIYFLIWTFSLIGLSDLLIKKYIRIMMELKRSNDWYVGEKNVIRIDTKVTNLKESMPVSVLWFIPAILISIISVVRAFLKREGIGDITVYIALIGLLAILIFIFLYNKYSNMRNNVYSNNSVVNILCNSIYKKKWSLCWIGVSTCNSITFALIIEGIIRGTSLGIVLCIIGIWITVFSVIMIIYTEADIKESINKVVYASEERLFTDTDEYWEKGYYCNPHDNRIMVEKRIGTGMCFNLGNKKGRILNYVGNIFVVILVVGICIYLLRFDISGFKMNINDNVIKIEAPSYEIEFNIDDVEGVELINEMPKATIKTNGIGGSHYSIGYFKLEGYGNTPIYIYRNSSPYLKIKLKDTYVFINGEKPDITKEYYVEITESIKR